MANQEPLSTPRQEEVGTGHDIMIVRGGTGENGRYWDTVSTIATAWREANPGSGMSHLQVMRWIIRENGLRDGQGRDCLGRENTAVIRRDQRLKVPEGNPMGAFDVVWEANCEDPPSERDILLFTTPEGTVIEETGPAAGPVGARLPDYLNAGSLAQQGATAEVYDGWNLPMMLGIMPDQPDPAARGLNRNGTGVHTAAGSLGHAATFIASVTPIPVASNVGLVWFPTFMVSGPTSSDRTMQGRQGGNGATGYAHDSADVAGRDGRFDGWPFNGRPLMPLALSERSFRDATLLPALGVQFDENNRIIGAQTRTGDPDAPNNEPWTTNNQIYFIRGENGEYVPSVTPARIEQETGRPNRFTQGEPGSPEALRGFSNYALAYLVNEQRIQPQISESLARYETSQDPAERRAAAQRAIELLNYQSTLTGISNYTVNVDVRGMAARGLNQEEMLALNPAERIAYQRERLIVDAETNGITGLNRDAMPAQSPVNSITRAELRTNLIEYYTDMATGDKEREFRAVYSRQVGEDADYNRRDAASVSEDVTRFVDSLPILNSMPEQGFNYGHMDQYFTSPRPRFNRVETREYAPQQRDGLTRDNATAAIDLIASDPRSTALLLSASGNGDIAQAWASYDDARVQMPRFFGSRRPHLDRAELLRGTEERGYRPELIGTVFSREETNGILRNLSGGQDLDAIRQDLTASAADPAIVALRQGDLRDMARGGGGGFIGEGAIGGQMLYALALEPDNRTLLLIEDNIRATAASPEIAAQQIEVLRQGVEYTKETISRDMLGTSHNQLIGNVVRRSYMSPGVIEAQNSGGITTEEVRTESVISAENVATLYNQFAGRPQAAQAFNRAIAGMGEAERAAYLQAIAGLPAEQQLVVARAIVGSNPASINALVTSGVNAETGAAFTAATASLTAENVGFVLNTIGMVPAASSAAITQIGGNAQASAAGMTALAGNPAAASQLAAALTDAQRTDIATRANLDATQADLWTSVAPVEVDHTIRRTAPVSDLTVSGTDVTRFRDAASLTGRARTVGTTRAWFEDPETRDRSLREVQTANPDIAFGLAIETLATNPDLLRAFRGQLQGIANSQHRGVFGWMANRVTTNKHEEVGNLIVQLITAQQRGDTATYNTLSQRLGALAENPAYQQAISDVTTAIMSTPAGRNNTMTGTDALATTTVAALDRTLTATSDRVLAFSPVTGDETLTNIHMTLTNVDYTNARELSNEGRRVISTSTSTSGWIVPFIPVWERPDRPYDPPTNEGPDPCPGCPVVPRPQPPTPPVPVR